MGLSDLLSSFDAAAYRRRIQTLGRNEICKREIQKCRQIYGAGFKMAGGAALALLTMGVSFIGTGLGARQYSIAEQKLAVIQQIMRENGWELHKETTRDVLIPLASTLVGMGVGGGVDVGIGHAVSTGTEMCVQQGVHQAAHHTASETFGAAARHPLDFFNGLGHGVEMGAGQATSILHPGDLATNSAMATMAHAIPLGSSPATSMGMVFGHTGILDGIQHAAAWVAGSAVNRSGDKVAGGRFRNGTMLDSAQHRNENLSTKSASQLRHLLKDYGVAASTSATKPQLLRMIDSIPHQGRSKSPVATRKQLALAILMFVAAAATWYLLSGWGYIDNSYVLESLSGLSIALFSSLCGLLNLVYSILISAVTIIFPLIWSFSKNVFDTLVAVCYWILELEAALFRLAAQALKQLEQRYLL